MKGWKIKGRERSWGTETASAVLSVAIERGADEHQPQVTDSDVTPLIFGRFLAEASGRRLAEAAFKPQVIRSPGLDRLICG
jgi:hypothetical protein